MELLSSVQSNGIVALTLGKILLIENTRASNPLLGYYQDITASTAADIGGKGPSLSFAINLLFLISVCCRAQQLVTLSKTKRMLVQSGCRGNDTTIEGTAIGQGRVICGWTVSVVRLSEIIILLESLWQIITTRIHPAVAYMSEWTLLWRSAATVITVG